MPKRRQRGSRFVSPAGRAGRIARIDQGVDYDSDLPFVAIASGTVVHIDPNFYNGTPAVYIKLDHPVTVNGRTYDAVYYSETKALVKVGQHVKAGEVISGPGAAEIGFASDSSGYWLPAAHGTYKEGMQTVPGHDFLDLAANKNTTMDAGLAVQHATASAHEQMRQLPRSEGGGIGFDRFPDEAGAGGVGGEAAQGFGAQTSFDQEGAFGLNPFQVADVWQQLANQQFASPETRQIASNAASLLSGIPDLLQGA